MMIDTDLTWVYKLKKRIVIGLVLLLVVTFALVFSIVFSKLKNSFLKEFRGKSSELSHIIKPLLEHYMLERSTELQSSLDELQDLKNPLNSIKIIDTDGRVAFSSNKAEVGKVFDRKTDTSCLPCHGNLNRIKGGEASVVVTSSGEDILRCVTVIYNGSKCYGCHSPQNRINGKLIIDRSLSQSSRFINSMKIMVFGSAAFAILLIVPFISIMINRYIDEIMSQKKEIGMLYSMVDSLSKTIDVEELKYLVCRIFKETFKADEIDIILPKGTNDFRAFTRYAGKDEIVRRKIEVNTKLYNVIILWLSGQLPAIDGMNNNKNIYMDISLGTNRLALIVIRKLIGSLNHKKEEFLSALSTHIAIAFENARLYSIAIADELTGLYTHRYFKYIMEKEYINIRTNSGSTLSLLILDLDNFKKVNDTYGHLIGDKVLEEAALTLRESIRENDYAFRYGGEEFTVVLHNTSIDQAMVLAQRIREAIEEMEIPHETGILKITVSIGVAEHTEKDETTNHLIARADGALYEAKRTGKNKIVRAAMP
ncbi:MAG: GGDEF domain-containing protein [Nitrospirae bacterium YQR-1]